MGLSLTPHTRTQHAPDAGVWTGTNWVQSIVQRILGTIRFSQRESSSLDSTLELKQAEQAMNSLFQVENWGQWLRLRTTSFDYCIDRAYGVKRLLDKDIRYFEYRASYYNALYRLEQELRNECAQWHIDPSMVQKLEQAMGNIRTVRDSYTTLNMRFH